MGAIVTVRVPRGTDVQSLRDKIKNELHRKTGETVSIAVNMIDAKPARQFSSSPNTNLAAGRFNEDALINRQF